LSGFYNIYKIKGEIKMKKYNHKKTVLILILCVTFGFITSCGGEKAGNNATTTQNDIVEENFNESKKDEKIQPDLPEVNYNGYTFTWLSHGLEGGNWVTPNPRELVAESENGDPINDIVYKRNMTVSEKYGVEFEMVPTNSEKSMLDKAAKAGDDLYDATLMYNNNAPSVMSANLLLDTNQLPYINFDKPWWDPAIKETSILGRNFFLAGDIMILDKESVNVFFFNKKLMLDLGMDFPYKYVLDGTWTYAKLDEYIKEGSADLNGDGKLKPDDDRFGLSIFNDTMHALFVGGGGLLAKNGSDGIPQPTFCDAASIELMDKIADVLYQKEYITNYHTNGAGNIDEMKQSFFDGRILILWGRLFVLDALRNMEDDFGILPMPKKSETQTRYYSDVNSYTGAMLGVPISVADPERTSIILEALAAESRYTLFPVYYDITLQRKYTRDEESGAMLDIIFETTVYDSGAAYNFGTIWGAMSDICGKESRDFGSWAEKNEAKVQKAIDKTVEFVQSMD
jgi:hypothetical protein